MKQEGTKTKRGEIKGWVKHENNNHKIYDFVGKAFQKVSGLMEHYTSEQLINSSNKSVPAGPECVCVEESTILRSLYSPGNMLSNRLIVYSFTSWPIIPKLELAFHNFFFSYYFSQIWLFTHDTFALSKWRKPWPWPCRRLKTQPLTI